MAINRQQGFEIDTKKIVLATEKRGFRLLELTTGILKDYRSFS